MRCEPARRISCLRSQGAVLGDSLLSELEQTSSPNSVVWCAGVSTGPLSVSRRISYRSTSQPRLAAVRAASGPARPPPMTRIFFGLDIGLNIAGPIRVEDVWMAIFIKKIKDRFVSHCELQNALGCRDWNYPEEFDRIAVENQLLP